MQRACALLLVGVFFLQLAAQANYMQLTVSQAQGGGKEPNPLLSFFTGLFYLATLGLVGLGVMRSAAGGDRYPDGQRAPTPNPKPLNDYPHSYQPWLTPGPNWGY